MKRDFYTDHSTKLDRDVNMLVYGEGGYPVIAFQVQDAKCNNFEDFGMIDVLAPFIDGGQIQVFSVDGFDEESWSSDGDKAARAAAQERFFGFVTDELVPRVHQLNGSDLRPLAIGCSMGATHAAIAAFRRPDLFQGCIALSGVYRTSYFFGDWMDETLYNNDITAFLTNMPEDHPYVGIYNYRQLVLCSGQGAWEEGLQDVRYIDDQLRRLHAAHWCDYWGIDVSHDWPWWRKQIVYFLPEVLADIQRTTEAEAALKASEEAPAAEAAPVAEEPVAEEPAAEKPVAEEPAPKKRATRRSTTKKATTTTRKTAAAKATEATETEAAEEKPAAKKTTRRTTRKTAAAKATETAEAEATEAKPAAKSTTRKTAAAKVTETAEAEATEAKPAAKSTTRKTSTTKKATTARKAPARRSTKKSDTAE